MPCAQKHAENAARRIGVRICLLYTCLNFNNIANKQPYSINSTTIHQCHEQNKHGGNAASHQSETHVVFTTFPLKYWCPLTTVLNSALFIDAKLVKLAAKSLCQSSRLFHINLQFSSSRAPKWSSFIHRCQARNRTTLIGGNGISSISDSDFVQVQFLILTQMIYMLTFIIRKFLKYIAF
jgi:hypothetical protein